MDKKYKVIRKLKADTARVANGDHFHDLIDDFNTSADVYADRGYPSKSRSQWLKDHGYRNPAAAQSSSLSRAPYCAS